MLKVGIITGSTRPNRKSLDVAKWVLEIAQKRSDGEYELVDIKDFELPLLDEPLPPSMGKYQQPHTKRWATKIASLDAFVFVLPEYNHGIPAALKNAIDFLFAEWNHKSAGFVSYGGAGGARAVEQLRVVLAEVHVAAVRAQVLLSMMTDFENFMTFKPAPQHEKAVGTSSWNGSNDSRGGATDGSNGERSIVGRFGALSRRLMSSSGSTASSSSTRRATAAAPNVTTESSASGIHVWHTHRGLDDTSPRLKP